MLFPVLQNFKYPSIQLIKTYRLKSIVKVNWGVFYWFYASTNLAQSFIPSNNNLLWYSRQSLLHYYCYKSYLRNHFSLKYHYNTGLMTNNITLTSLYMYYHNLKILSENKKTPKPLLLTPPVNNELDTKLVQPIVVTTISIQKNYFNTFMYYIYLWILTPILPLPSLVNFRYSFIFLQKYFRVYLFLNEYYFKVKHF